MAWKSGTSAIPRRHDTQRWTLAETRIADAVHEVEAMPADQRLTDAVVLLQAAKDRVADFVDGVNAHHRVVPRTDAELNDNVHAERVAIAGRHGVAAHYGKGQTLPECVKAAIADAEFRGVTKGESAADERLKALASAMRKLLPPELLAEVMDRLDPLGAFVRALREER